MKKLFVFLILFPLIFTVSAAYMDEQYLVRQDFENRLFTDFCLGIKDNGRCNVPSPWNEVFKGVCCGGQCNAYTERCGEPGWGGPSLLDVIVNMPCENQRDGSSCVLPPQVEKKYPAFEGVCCGGQCMYMEDSCKREMDDGGYVPGERDIQKEIEALTTLICLGLPDGEECPIGDKELVQVANLYGVCCDEKCHWRSTECPEDAEDAKPDLVVIGMEFWPEDLSRTLGIERVKLTVKNQGAGTAEKGFWIEFDKGDGSSPITREMPLLGAGEDATVLIENIAPYRDAGRYLLEASVDSNPNSLKNNLVDEADEKNNHATVEVYVGENIKASCGDGICEPDEVCPEDCKKEDREVICGDGVCAEGEKEGCPGDCEPVKIGLGRLLPLAAGVILLLVIVYLLSKRKKGGGVDYELQIQRLLREKKTIEEMIELAKAKYHKRKLDEESFKEIVKENQKKLIEVETRIGDIEEFLRKRK